MRQLMNVQVMTSRVGERVAYYYTITYVSGTVKTRGPYTDYAAMLKEIMAELES